MKKMLLLASIAIVGATFYGCENEENIPQDKSSEKEIKIEMCAENKAMIQDFISKVTGKSPRGSVGSRAGGKSRMYLTGGTSCIDDKYGNCLYEDVVIYPEKEPIPGADQLIDSDDGWKQIDELKEEGLVEMEKVASPDGSREVYIYTAGEEQLVIPVVYRK